MIKLLKSRKVTVNGKRVKVPMFLPKGPRPAGGWSELQLAEARKKQEDFIERYRSPHGKVTSEAMANGNGNGKHAGGPRVTGPYTRLNILAEVHTNHKKGWTLESAHKLLTCIAEEMKDNSYGGYAWNPVKAAKATGMSTSGCTFFYHELKKALKDGYTLESYFRAGRPLRTGKKVLA